MVGVYSFLLLLTIFYCLFCSVLFLFIHDQTKEYRAFAFVNSCITLLLSCCSFFINAGNYNDMTRIAQEINISQTSGINYLYTLYSSSPLSALLFSVGVLLGDYRFVPVISTFLYYSIMFKILYALCKRYKCSPMTALFGSTILFWSVSFFWIALNVRMWVALPLSISGILLLEMPKTGVRKKRLYIFLGFVLCLAGILAHAGILPMIMIYAITKIFIQADFKFQAAILLLYSFSIDKIASTLSNSSNTFLSYLGSKLTVYFGLEGQQSSWDMQQGRLAWLYIIVAICLSSFLLFVDLRQVKNIRNSELPKIYTRFLFGMLMFLCGSFQSYTMASRYAAFVYILSIPLLIKILDGYFQRKGTTCWREAPSSTLILRHCSFIVSSLVLVFLVYTAGNFPSPERYTFDFSGNGTLISSELT